MAVIGVIFDMDETLIYEYRSVDESFRAAGALAQEAYGVDPEALRVSVIARSREMWHVAPMRPYTLSVGLSSWEGLSGPFSVHEPYEVDLVEWTPSYRVLSWARGLADHGVDDEELARRCAQAFQVERDKRHIFFPEALECLHALHGKYRLGMLTNGAPSVQRAKIAGADLEKWFDAIVVTGALGVGKPAPETFSAILKALDLAPAEAVMVGDNPDSDIRGARQVGMRSVWINREGKPCNPEYPPDVELPDLKCLPEVLESIRG